jgi:hypothetical protein
VAPHNVVLACVPGELHVLPLVVLDATLRSTAIVATRLAPPTLALGPGWHVDDLPPHVVHSNTLAGAREHITSLVSTP